MALGAEFDTPETTNLRMSNIAAVADAKYHIIKLGILFVFSDLNSAGSRMFQLNQSVSVILQFVDLTFMRQQTVILEDLQQTIAHRSNVMFYLRCAATSAINQQESKTTSYFLHGWSVLFILIAILF